MRNRLRVAEIAGAVSISAASVWLNIVAASSAGPLWRDEANTVGLATSGSVKYLFANLQFDSFPLLWPLLVRGYSSMFGPMNDAAFRTIGFLTGLAIIAALWLNARVFRYKLPLISLALFALSPSVIRWGDSMRAYGTGMVAILVSSAALWRFIESPSRRRFILATLAVVISVHLLYYNAVITFVLCLSGICVCASQRKWKEAGMVALIGFIAAASMLLYVSAFRSAGDWNALVKISDYNAGWFMLKLDETLNQSGPWALALWIDLAALAALVGIRHVYRSGRDTIQNSDDARVLFALLLLISGSGASYLFLKTLSYLTQPWYYLTLLTIVALSIDIILGIVCKSVPQRITRLAGALILAALTLASARAALGFPISNVDRIAGQLGRVGNPSDLIVLAPWHFGVSFSRYYHGDTPWVTLPQVGFYRFHRYDVIKQAMKSPNQLAPIESAIEETQRALRSGHKVFLVGRYPSPRQAEAIPLLGPAPTRSGLWPEPEYQMQWSAAFRRFVLRHAGQLHNLSLDNPVATTKYEDVQVVVATGWRP